MIGLPLARKEQHRLAVLVLNAAQGLTIHERHMEFTLTGRRWIQ